MKTQKLFVIVVSVCLMAFFSVLSFAQTTPGKSYYVQPDDVQPALAGSVAEAVAQSLAAQGYEVRLDGTSVKIATNRGELSLDLPATGEGLERNEVTLSVDGMMVNQDVPEDLNTNLLIALSKLNTCLNAANLFYELDSASCFFTVNDIFKVLCETEALAQRIMNTARCAAQFAYLAREVVANAGADQAVDTGASVTLDGRRSTPISTPQFPGSYAWVITAKPEGSMAQLANPNTVDPIFFTDVDGTYTVELTYKFLEESDTDSVDVVATTPPTP